MSCPVCQYNQVKDVDRALLTGASPGSLSKQYSFSVPALERHQEHLLKKMARTQKRFHDYLHQGLFCKLNLVMEMVLFVVRGAKAGEDFKLFLQASREFTRILSLMHKMQVQLDPELIYCLMASPQWDLQDNLLPAAFEALDKTRQSLKLNLYARCPEPEPELDPEPAPPPSPEPQHSKPATPLDQMVSQAPPATPVANPKLPTGNQPKKKREISAKFAPKTINSAIINEEYQTDNVCEKNIPPKRENLFQKVWRQWEKSGKKMENCREKPPQQII